MATIELPSYDQFMNPILQAIRELGGSARIDEIDKKVIAHSNLSAEQLAYLHDAEKTEQTEVEYRLAWARTYLKKYGILENPNRGFWKLRNGVEQVDPLAVKRFVREGRRSGLTELTNKVVEETKDHGRAIPSELKSEFLEEVLDEQSGVDYEKGALSESDAPSIQPFDPTLIRIDNRALTVDLMMRRIKENEINLTPDFQRMGGIWNDEAQSRLIESLLLRIPLPAFYLDASDDEKWLVIDGLQRLTTLQRFILDKGDKSRLRLRGLEFWREYEKKTFDELPRALQRRIEETQLTLYLIQSGTPHKVKFNIFKRINTGGVPLSGQEIRHALNLGVATDLLQDLAKSLEFQKATDYSVSPMRMTDRECVLRFLAFKLKKYSEYTSRDELDSFLSEQMQEINQKGKNNPEFIESLRKSFKRTMNLAYDIFGDRAFRKLYSNRQRRSTISKALFEVWSVNLDKLKDEQQDHLLQHKEKIIEKFIALMDDNEFHEAISYSTGDRARVHYRFRKIEQLIEEILHA